MLHNSDTTLNFDHLYVCKGILSHSPGAVLMLFIFILIKERVCTKYFEVVLQYTWFS